MRSSLVKTYARCRDLTTSEISPLLSLLGLTTMQQRMLAAADRALVSMQMTCESQAEERISPSDTHVQYLEDGKDSSR
eukprot:3680423-Rhodomonas_salina.2